jgi:sugar transferase (PEP-CTERM/EpsH1 system associated)
MSSAHGLDRQPPLVAHIIHRLDVGGLENGVVNLINWMPPERYRHCIIALTGATRFRERIQRPDVPVFELHKREGHDLGLYRRLWTTLRRLEPSIVHTRNMATLEGMAVAWAAGVPGRVHGEHGWDVVDLDGTNPRYRLLRRAMRPFVQHYITVSRHLQAFLEGLFQLPAERVSQIYNGVDSERFHPGRRPVGPPGFASDDTRVIGTVGRMQQVKDQLTLVRAFIELRALRPGAAKRLRLVLIGDGPLRGQAEQLLRSAGVLDQAWLPGPRDDIPDMLRGMDLFVLPSLAEGISNTILEAMATALPVIATAVGGNAELVIPGSTGRLVPANDPQAMAAALADYLDAPTMVAEHGRAARVRIEKEFSPSAMVARYLAVYDSMRLPIPA